MSVEKEFLEFYMLRLRHGQYPNAKSILNDYSNVSEIEQKGKEFRR